MVSDKSITARQTCTYFLAIFYSHIIMSSCRISAENAIWWRKIINTRAINFHLIRINWNCCWTSTYLIRISCTFVRTFIRPGPFKCFFWFVTTITFNLPLKTGIRRSFASSNTQIPYKPILNLSVMVFGAKTSFFTKNVQNPGSPCKHFQWISGRE